MLICAIEILNIVTVITVINAQKRTPSHGSLARDLATEDDCNSRTDEVYTNTERVITTFLNARLSQYLVPEI